MAVIALPVELMEKWTRRLSVLLISLIFLYPFASRSHADFSGEVVGVIDGDDGAGEGSKRSEWIEQEQQKTDQVSYPSPPAVLLLRHNVNGDLVRGPRWDFLLGTSH